MFISTLLDFVKFLSEVFMLIFITSKVYDFLFFHFLINIGVVRLILPILCEMV